MYASNAVSTGTLQLTTSSCSLPTQPVVVKDSMSVPLQGYLPAQLYNLNSCYGSKEQLQSLTWALNYAGIKPIADIVINHRCADVQNAEGIWNSYRCILGPCMCYDLHKARGAQGPAPTVQSSYATVVHTWLCAVVCVSNCKLCLSIPNVQGDGASTCRLHDDAGMMCITMGGGLTGAAGQCVGMTGTLGVLVPSRPEPPISLHLVGV